MTGLLVPRSCQESASRASKKRLPAFFYPDGGLSPDSFSRGRFRCPNLKSIATLPPEEGCYGEAEIARYARRITKILITEFPLEIALLAFDDPKMQDQQTEGKNQREPVERAQKCDTEHDQATSHVKRVAGPTINAPIY
jgi:hypothetical protein